MNTEYSNPDEAILVLCEQCVDDAEDEDDVWLIANGIRQATDDPCDICGRKAHR